MVKTINNSGKNTYLQVTSCLFGRRVGYGWGEHNGYPKATHREDYHMERNTLQYITSPDYNQELV